MDPPTYAEFQSHQWNSCLHSLFLVYINSLLQQQLFLTCIQQKLGHHDLQVELDAIYLVAPVCFEEQINENDENERWPHCTRASLCAHTWPV